MNQDFFSTSNEFQERHLGPSDSEIQLMLKELGFSNLDEMAAKVIPKEMHAQLQSQAAHLKQALQPLDEAMAALDFAQAAAHCRSLIEDFASLTP